MAIQNTSSELIVPDDITERSGHSIVEMVAPDGFAFSLRDCTCGGAQLLRVTCLRCFAGPMAPWIHPHQREAGDGGFCEEQREDIAYFANHHNLRYHKPQ